MPNKVDGLHPDDKQVLVSLVKQGMEQNFGAKEGTGSGPPDMPSAIAKAVENDAVQLEFEPACCNLVATLFGGTGLWGAPPGGRDEACGHDVPVVRPRGPGRWGRGRSPRPVWWVPQATAGAS